MCTFPLIVAPPRPIPELPYKVRLAELAAACGSCKSAGGEHDRWLGLDRVGVAVLDIVEMWDMMGDAVSLEELLLWCVGAPPAPDMLRQRY